MKIALIGASGFIGEAILLEALERGHQVISITRHPEKLTPHKNLIAKKGDVHQEDKLAELISDTEVVISAYNPWLDRTDGKSLNGMQSMVNAIRKSKNQRLVVVGGAGSLYIVPGVQLLDSPEFPAEWKGMAEATREALHTLKKSKDVAWTFLSPAHSIAPGERTGRFRLGLDELIKDSQGVSKISTQDYAIALMNEVEHPKHTQKRFTVGY